jgi:hypothetical protein
MVFRPTRNSNPFERPFGMGQRVFGGSGLSLPTENLLALWYAGDGGSAHASVGVADGQTMSAWDDSGNNGYNLTATGSPVYRQSVAVLNNRGGVEFGGSAYLSRALAGVVGGLSSYAVYAVFITTQATTGALYSEGSTLSNTQSVMCRHRVIAAGDVGLLHRDNSNAIGATTGGANANNGNAKLACYRRNGTTFNVRLNGLSVGSGTQTLSTITLNSIAVGTVIRATPVNTFVGTTACVAVYSDDSNYTTIEPLLTAHYNPS